MSFTLGKKYQLLFCIIWVIASVFFCIDMLKPCVVAYQWMPCTTVSATVVDARMERSNNSGGPTKPRLVVTYQYEVRGRRFTGQDGPGTNPRPTVGQTVMITYLTDHPSISCMVGGHTVADRAWPLRIVVLWIAATIIGVVYTVILARRLHREKQRAIG